jgi:hypothetical protein
MWMVPGGIVRLQIVGIWLLCTHHLHIYGLRWGLFPLQFQSVVFIRQAQLHKETLMACCGGGPCINRVVYHFISTGAAPMHHALTRCKLQTLVEAWGRIGDAPPLGGFGVVMRRCGGREGGGCYLSQNLGLCSVVGPLT